MRHDRSVGSGPGAHAAPVRRLPGGRALRAGMTAALLIGAVSCDDDPVGPSLRDPGTEIIVAFDADASAYPADDWNFRTGALDGDTLELEVGYAGGCEEHRFWLLAVDDWIPLMDAGPTETTGVALRLAHAAAGDPCEAALTSTLRFGLGPLRAAYRAAFGPGPARLVLQITDGRDGFALHVFDWRLGD